MGGDIAVKSKLGFGTTMITIFPSETVLETLPMECPKAALLLKKKTLLAGKRCLIVDDIQENTYILTELLQYHGMEVVTTNQAADALEKFITILYNRVNLVITDLRMPGMSGQTLILEIRKFEKSHARAEVPIIVFTGESSPTEKVACLSQYGANEYLLKPVKLHDLIKAVEKLLSKVQAQHLKSVLLVDDDVVSRKIIVSLLKQHGEKCDECGCIEEAKQKVREGVEKYDVIFLDSELPDGTGSDFMDYYRQHWLGLGFVEKQVPVVSMSGNSVQDQQRKYASHTNMHAYLQKPVSKSALIDAITSLRQ